ncbi:16S rRNA (guanine(966)-N(2))-methyltransferase RsmD [Pseudonocardia spinosispora]|uniref:16S rRNA (guanine(966)-N(2))-methyltransferase RsmD n=1 Tax=Pseudonocardia spinosispora TaxID=103441 RepID=UPI00040559D4|nr:16S rRNA (guanine(966)-N(2))-methyltransferase RsmD [Pseudonocardia spinosispora]
MTRIIAGSVGGRRIAVPPDGTRPTSDRVREALFSSLQADPGLDGASVLDLCAGSGALGIEALSRGAGHALFVESDRRAAATIRRNLADLGLTSSAELRTASAASVLSSVAPRRYDVLLADPPYSVPDDEVAEWLAAAVAQGWLAEGATVVVERSGRRKTFEWPASLEGHRVRKYGSTVLHVGLCYGSVPW